MLSTAWPAPAKLNLFLHITGRRHDGYHLLQTAFQFIDWRDQLDFKVHRRDEVRRGSVLVGVAPEQDLAVRAALKLKQYTGCGQGADIFVHKNIPPGGGLGGGSSDAATTLVALNHLWQTGCGPDELMRLGLELGADVPVFVQGRSAWAEGVGEKMTPLEPAEAVYLVIHPGCGVSTAGIFAADDLTRNTPAITIRDFLEGRGKNDCEAVVKRRYGEIRRALDWLGRYAPARLTGTGACLFAPFASQQAAAAVKAQAPAGWQARIVRGMNRSPLLDRLWHEARPGRPRGARDRTRQT